MKVKLNELVGRLDGDLPVKTNLFKWAAPVIAFGNIETSKIGTIGLNPSNREFVDIHGRELLGSNRRFHTLQSLNIPNWSEATNSHFDLIRKSCDRYFFKNPYDLWFRKLDTLFNKTGISYYNETFSACHLDIVPFATQCKWTQLSKLQKSLLIDSSSDFLGTILNNSNINILILNGKTVVDHMQKLSNTEFKSKCVKTWTLPRTNNDGVQGYSFTGSINRINGVRLNRKVMVLGFNHNLQSSFGVTNEVQRAIKIWITRSINDSI